MLSPALYETLLLGVLGTGGLSLLALLGAKDRAYLAGAAPLGLALLCLVLFPFTVFIGLPLLETAILGSLALSGLAFTRRKVSQLALQASAIHLAIVGFASIMRFVLNVPQRASEDSVQLLMQAVLEIQNGLPSDNIRRGLAYSLLISLAPEGRVLTTVSPYITLAILVISVAACRRYLQDLDVSERNLAIILGIVVVVSAPIFWVMTTYAAPHSLLALAITSLVALTLEIRRDFTLSHSRVVLMSATAFVAAATRFEGIILAVLAVMPAFELAYGVQGSRRFTILSVPLFAFLSLFIWVETSQAQWPVPPSIILTITVLLPWLLMVFGPRWSGSSTFPVVQLSIAGLLVGLFLGHLAFYGPEARLKILSAHVQNFLLGISGWGALIIATFALGTILAFVPGLRLFRDTWTIWILGMLGTLFLKMLDSPPGNVGFNNTLARTFFHWIGPLLISWVLGAGFALKRSRLVFRLRESWHGVQLWLRELKRRSQRKAK